MEALTLIKFITSKEVEDFRLRTAGDAVLWIIN